MEAIYNVNPGDVYWAASDVGWVVGHSYIVYAPLIHGCLGTAGQGGTVRISLGTFTNQQDIDAVVVAIAEIATAALSV